MFPALPFHARFFAAVIAVTALASVVARYIYDQSLGDEPPLETIWSLARFFTLLTNTLVAVTFAFIAFRRDGVSPPWIAALTLSIMLVGAVYHTLLAGLVTFTGLGVWADQGLHTAVPIACFLWWVFCAPKRTLQFRDLPMFIVWPCVYVAYALARGAQDGVYPYPFMSLATRDAATVATNLFGLVLVLLIGGVIFVLIGRFADR
ncbi:Pr6Pr family membrane protein [Gymnodinialimonas sp.]